MNFFHCDPHTSSHIGKKPSRKAETLREQQKQIESQEATIRSSVADMQKQGREIVRTYDAQVERMAEMDIHPDRDLQKRRNWLDQTSNADMTTKPAGYLLNLLQPLSDEKSAVVNQLKTSESNLEVAKNTNVSRLEDIRKLQSMVNKDHRTMNSWMQDFRRIAEDLVDHSTPEQIQEYESRGLHKSIGKDVWKHAKDTSKERIEKLEREQSQCQGRSRGIRL